MDQRLTQVFKDAISLKASDISFLPAGDSYQVKFCVAGIFKKYQVMDASTISQWISFLKYQAEMALSEKRRPQLGALRYELEQKQYFLRLSTVGDFLNRESLVIRIIYPSQKIAQGCFFAEQWDRLNQACHKRGLILFAGPMGNGKTTTMYSLAKNLTEKQVMCIEDPIEIYEPDFLQIQVNDKAEMTYAALLKVALRHHPDVFIIGEIRDNQTAKIAINAALSGHLVLSTVHAASCYGVWQRMENLGISAFELRQTLQLVSYQRLIPTTMNKSMLLFDILTGDEMAEKKACQQMTRKWGEHLDICVKNGWITPKNRQNFAEG